jgi:hypothetical protein
MGVEDVGQAETKSWKQAKLKLSTDRARVAKVSIDIQP